MPIRQREASILERIEELEEMRAWCLKGSCLPGPTSQPVDVSALAPPATVAPTASDKATPPARRRRSAWSRDHAWQRQFASLKTYGAVRDWWNGLTDEERARHAPYQAKINPGKAGWSIVQKGIKKAGREPDSESEQ
ncbi:MAG: hypothetical protein K2Y37_12985 [Pirellulales bacterium]|nr:hypothetical protein [Pirellulales bacterium]